MEKNFAGLKVLDFTRVLVGPYLTQIMADNGAEVIKIEKPFYGADERHNAPIWEGKNGFQSGYFMMLNRGKKSVVLDMKDPECKQVIYQLMEWADIICENFAPGVMEKLGFGYEEAKKRNPSVIYCSMSVFGQEGPYSKLPGYDIIAQAMSGLMWLTGDADGSPMRSGTAIGDVNASGYALGAIGMALYYKARTGKGQYIDISLRDCLACELETGIIRYTMSYGKDVPMRCGPHHATMMPYGIYNAGKGRYIVLVALNPNHWDALCKVMGKEEWGAQEKFKDSLSRGINQNEVIPVIEEWLQSFDDFMDAVKVLQEHRIPAAPILVCIKQVPDTTEIKIDPVKNTLIREGVPSIVNPFDGYALEAAARIKDKDPGAKIVVVSMGPEQAKNALKECLAIAADKAYLVSGRAFGGSDTLATSYILSNAVGKLEELEGKFDLIFCGKQAIDGDTAQVGPELAEHLGYPQVTYGLEAEVDGDTIKVKKEVEEGVEVIAAKMPCVVTFTKPAWDPRYPTIKRKMAANRAEIPTLGEDAFPEIDTTRIGLKGSPTHVKKTFVPQKKTGGVKIKEESNEESAKKLFQLLSDASVI